MIDNNLILQHWAEIRNLVMIHWNKLSKEEVDKTKGNTNSLGKLVQKFYGEKENFDYEFEKICLQILKNNGLTAPNGQRSEKFMDKNLDDHYLMGENGVTRKAENTETMKDLTDQSVGEEGFNPPGTDGFNDENRHPHDNDNN